MRLVCGWGINDADYDVIGCLIYSRWAGMIKRCRCPKFQAKRPTYIDCRVDESWRSFMIFRAWHLEQSPELGEQLDKDFLGDGKLYSPETCCFVPACLNTFFNDCRATKGLWSQGVSYCKQTKKFRAKISHKSETISLGRFNTPEEASAAYLKAKAAYIEELLVEFPQPLRLVAAIRRKMTELIQQERNV